MNDVDSKHASVAMLKATSAIAGGRLVTIFIAICRTKILAILLGPAGMGVVNLVGSSVDLARVLFAFGLDGATVRKVAEAATIDDPALLDQVYRVAARTALFIGSAACLAIAAVSPLLSAKILGTADHFWWFALAGCSLICTPLLGVQLAFLQGMKQTRSLAICQIIASTVGALLTISLVATMGKIGAIMALLPVSVASLAIHHHFLKHHRPAIEVPRHFNQFQESRKLLKFGSGFAINGIWLVTAGWLNLIFIRTYYGEARGVLQVGLYGAASTLANFYISILITSMATEFYPSLIQVARDRNAFNRLLNQQTMLSIGLGVPATLGMLACAPLILSLLYSREFIPGSELMRWLLVGMTIRFVTIPLGITLLAVGSPRMIALSELAMGTVMVIMSYVMLQIHGLTGLGMAMVITNLLQLIGLLWVCRRLGVFWNPRTTQIVVITLVVALSVLAICTQSEQPARYLAAGVIIGAHALYMFGILRHDTGITLAAIRNRIFKQT
jgi:antigen flippase